MTLGEPILKEKAHYSWPPETSLLRATSFDIANIIYFFTKQANLMRRSTILSVPPPPLLVFPAFIHYIINLECCSFLGTFILDIIRQWCDWMFTMYLGNHRRILWSRVSSCEEGKGKSKTDHPTSYPSGLWPLCLENTWPCRPVVDFTNNFMLVDYNCSCIQNT